MSTRDREPESPGPLKYAPKWARDAAPEPARGSDKPRSEPRPVNARPAERKPPPVRRPREPAPPWQVAKQKGGLEGDVAIKELRERMALAPDQPPEPPMREEGGSVFGMVGRLAGLVTMAAIGAYGFVWISTPRDPPEEHGFALAAYENPAAGEEPGAAPNNGGFRPAVFQPPPLPASNFRAATLRPRDEAPPVDPPQLLAPVPWPAPDPGPRPPTHPPPTPTPPPSPAPP